MASKVIRRLTKKLCLGVARSKSSSSSSSSVSSDASTILSCGSSSSSVSSSSECYPKNRRTVDDDDGRARIPVFMLPRKDSLSRIPEDQEIRQGFSVIVELKPDSSFRSERSCYAGLMSISDLDDQPDLIEETATRGVQYRCFSWLKKC